MRTVAGCPGVRGHRDGAAYVARFDTPVAVAVTAQGLEGPIYIADAGIAVVSIAIVSIAIVSIAVVSMAAGSHTRC